MDKRFVIINHKGDVSVLDTETNGELFYIGATNEEDAKWIENELDTIVRALNEQDKLLKEHNIPFP